MLQPVLDQITDFKKFIDQIRVKLCTFSFFDNLHRPVMVKWFFIGTLRRQSIIYIDNTHDPGLNRNVCPRKPHRIALAIPALMKVQRHIF